MATINPKTYYPRLPAVPNLPLAPDEWDRRFQDQFANVLRLYFNQVNGLITTLASPQGAKYLDFPYGAFHDTTTQTAASTTAAYNITLNTTDFSNGVALQSGYKMVVDNPGLYNLQFSVQLQNNDNAPQDIDIWVRQNDVDVAASNSRFGLEARKAVGNPSHTVAALNIFINMAAGDSVSLAWCTTNLSANIPTYAAGTSPTRPVVPSVIATLAFVSAPPG
jgi:hypothetical protein